MLKINITIVYQIKYIVSCSIAYIQIIEYNTVLKTEFFKPNEKLLEVTKVLTINRHRNLINL